MCANKVVIERSEKKVKKRWKKKENKKVKAKS